MTQKNLNRMQEAFEYVEPEVRIKKRPRNAWEEIAVPNFVPAWSETVSHYTLDMTDAPPKQIEGVGGEAMPTLDYTESKDSKDLMDFGFWLTFNLKDMRAVERGDTDPIARRTQLAFLRERKALYDTIINGGGIEGLTGIANAPVGEGVGEIPIIAQVGGRLDASSKTDQQRLDDLNRLYNQTGTATEGVAPANVMFAPLEAIQILNTARIPNAPLNVLQTFVQSVQDTTGEPFLIRQNQSFGKDIVMGRSDVETARINISQTLLFGEMQWDGFAFKIPCRYAHSGWELLDSFSFAKMQNVIA